MKQKKRQSSKSNAVLSDIVIGLFDGLDNVLWCFGFATILFAGALSVFLPLGISIILTGWALLGIFVAATSKVRVHLTSIDEQAVVILASAGVLMVAQMGESVAAGPRGLTTFLALIVLTSVAVALSFVLIGRFRLARLLELLPYPVICGFMAGVGWLLLDAAVYVTVGESISANLPLQLAEQGKAPLLLITIACGLGLSLWVNRINQAWSLPVASLIIFAGFYALVFVLGMDQPNMVASGWLFDVAAFSGGSLTRLLELSPADIDVYFILSMTPQILTIVFLALLSVSMSLTAMATASRHHSLDTSEEMRKQGAGNLLCAAVGCPPGYTDVAASVLYDEIGASTRWMPLVSNAVCLTIAIFGAMFVGFMPKVLVAATIFMFAFLMLYEWLYKNVRGFQPIDFAIVLIILTMVIFVNFTVGVITGIVLTLLLFVMRYSMISAIQGRYSLRDYRSSVERPTPSNQVLDQHGSGTMIYTLRGFLFFGTANAVLDRIKLDLGQGGSEHKAALLDFKRVTGIDISALNTFMAVKDFCESQGVKVMYSGVRDEIEERIVALDAVSVERGKPMVFPELDFALEYLEEDVLRTFTGGSGEFTVRQQLELILPDAEKIELLLESMSRKDCKAGQTLFLQGDADNGFYVLESGHLSAFIDAPGGHVRRVKKFGPGSLIGEMSSYSVDEKRTASVVADDDSVLYHMSSLNLHFLEGAKPELAAVIHELIARTLGSRISYMNRRLLLELE
jgi:SulP family sulfate permease